MEQEFTVNVSEFVGKKFNRLRVIEPTKRGNRTRLYWKCQCDCGETVEIRQDRLLSGTTKSCGCLQKEIWGRRIFIRKDEMEAQKLEKKKKRRNSPRRKK